MVMASTQVARAAAQLHEAAQDVARVAASRSAQPEDMTMNGRSTGSQHADRHPRLAASQPVLSHHRLPTVTMADAARFAPFAARWPLRTFLELGALPGAVPCARLHTRNVLAEWGLTVFSESIGLLVSELVTNAIQISRLAEQDAPVRLWLVSDRAQVVIFVWDASPLPPVPGDVGEDAESGRGLLIVQAVSARWGWDFPPGMGGKVVWAVLGGVSYDRNQ
jgi:anti-sigma regulatory factor (Ser/Thr protein kinase)